MFAIAIAVVLGAVFYGLNNSTINQAGTSSTARHRAVVASRSASGHARPDPSRQHRSGNDHRCCSGAPADATGYGPCGDEPACQQRAGQQLTAEAPVI